MSPKPTERLDIDISYGIDNLNTVLVELCEPVDTVS